MTSASARACIAPCAIPLLLVGLSACGGATTSSQTPDTPPASTAISSPSSSSSVSAATYCAPLAAAYKVKPPSGVALSAAQLADLAKFGKLLGSAADAATADGKPEIAKLLTVLGTMNTDPTSVTAQQAGEAAKETAKLAPTIKADCKINILE